VVHSADLVDALFQRAVSAIDAGDAAVLSRYLEEHPELACVRLEEPGGWLRESVGEALDGFFERPFLLWFVAEDPVRNDRLPSNIVEMAEIIITAARRQCENIKEQVDYALQLVAWSWVAAREGVQVSLIDALVESGADLNGSAENALVNGHLEAAAHLVGRGAPLSLATAALLGHWSDFAELAVSANVADMQFALTLAALRGDAEAVRQLIRIDADPNVVSHDLYSHALPLHHAVSSCSLEAVKELVVSGARLDVRDSLHEGTPLDWAEYMAISQSKYEPIVSYLRSMRSLGVR
jgi:hypothetical protein